MEPHLFEAADRHVDEIAEALEAILPSEQLQKVREALTALGKSLGARYSVSLSCLVEVFDREQGRTLPLLNAGLSTSEGAEPYPVTGDSTSQRYLVDGQLQVVPQDRCPKCWGPWDFKWQHRNCPHCDAQLGRNCKVLLDSDACPHCEEGKVTASRPRCPKCGFEVDLSLVSWG
jgi:hypothetical protein